jgi:hypothetical protein
MAGQRNSDLPTGGDVPETNRTVHGRRDGAHAVGAERSLREAIPAIEWCAQLLVGRGIPGRAVLSEDAVRM